jgi:putative ABC transport system permease protein
VVGGLGLMGTMSMNVMERTREIGVLRACGATDWAVLQVIMVEGMMFGMISWVLGAALSVPMSLLLGRVVGIPILSVPLKFVFSMEGFITWLVLVILLSAISSFIPARNASRLTIREVLAYE